MCGRFAAIYNSFSDEKKNVLYIVTAGHYYCPHCRQVHYIPYKERETDEGVSS